MLDPKQCWWNVKVYVLNLIEVVIVIFFTQCYDVVSHLFRQSITAISTARYDPGSAGRGALPGDPPAREHAAVNNLPQSYFCREWTAQRPT